MIAAGVTIETHTHPFDNFERPIAYAGRGYLPVTIGANSVIGYNTVLTAGASVGYRAIIGANSVEARVRNLCFQCPDEAGAEQVAGRLAGNQSELHGRLPD